jgi:hypothetical protein
LASQVYAPKKCDRCDKQYKPTNANQKYCVDCRPVVRREWDRAHSADWRIKHPEITKSMQRRAIEKNPGRYSSMQRLWSARYIARMKYLVLGRYSNETLACSCCGESNLDLLTLDHVNNDGAAERRELFGIRRFGGSSFYRTLIKRDFPPGYAVLCMNCNWSKGKHGVCIHQTSRFVLPSVACRR